MSRKWFHNSAIWFHHKIPEYNDEKQGLKKSTEIYEDMFPRLATLNFELYVLSVLQILRKFQKAFHINNRRFHTHFISPEPNPTTHKKLYRQYIGELLKGGKLNTQVGLYRFNENF